MFDNLIKDYNKIIEDQRKEINKSFLCKRCGTYHLKHQPIPEGCRDVDAHIATSKALRV